MDIRSRLLKMEESLRAAGRLERETLALAAFEVFISQQALDHLSFATPVSPGPANWTAHVAALKEAFESRGKRPRLEFIEELHPALAPALEEAGLRCEMRAPLMTLDLADLPGAPPAERSAGEYVALEADDEALLRRYLLQQSVAYGGEADASSAPDDVRALDWLPSLRAGLRGGRVMGAALAREGQLLAGAVIQIGAGVGELAGVWSDAQRRRQGLAYALCRQLLAAYNAAGYEMCWLSAAEGAQRLYEKLGFVTVGTQLNYGAARA